MTIEIKGQTYRVLKSWKDKHGNRWVTYRDSEVEKTWIHWLFVVRKTRVIENGWRRWDRETLNLWNPLTWIVLFFGILQAFISGGVREVKENHFFKPMLSNAYWYKRDDIKW